MMTLEIMRWLLVLAGLFLLGIPVSYQFLRFLPGKGISFARVISLLSVSYIYWLLCTLGLLHNAIGAMVLSLGIYSLVALSLFAKKRNEILSWLKANGVYCLAQELIFLAGFSLILAFRISDPNIAGTEKPMEMTFISGILRSETFPPNDLWLSGYSISYYYFGYVMTALLIRLSHTLPTVGFNLMLATVYGVAAAAAFSIVNDLIEKICGKSALKVSIRKSALLSPLFLLVSGNFEGLFEQLYAKHFFWENERSAFWKWVNLKELSDAPAFLASWNPTHRQGIWWWRASRVVSDVGMDGGVKEVIDEFPFFSFLLGDLHPHVIGIPFVLLAVAVSMNFLFQRMESPAKISFLHYIADREIKFSQTWLGGWLRGADFWFSAFAIGGLLFMNTWDFPFYFGLFCIVSFLCVYMWRGWDKHAISIFFETALALGAACVLFYGLFLISLSTQAGGIAPSGFFSTRTIHFVIMFGLFLTPLLTWLIMAQKKCGSAQRRGGFRAAATIFLILFALETLSFIVLRWFNALGPTLQPSANKFLSGLGGAMALAGSAFSGVQGLSGGSNDIPAFLLSRLRTLPTSLILFGAVGCIWTIFLSLRNSSSVVNPEQPDEVQEEPSSREAFARYGDLFVGAMCLVGLGLIIAPEFFYLRDFFGTRMNTIFKFYYQAWILLSLSSAYACFRVFQSLSSKISKGIFTAALSVSILISLIYPYWGIQSKLSNLIFKARNSETLSLDGSAFLKKGQPDNWAGIEWLKNAEMGVIVEKVGGSYTSENAASTFSGLPSILGPMNHESQWRGGYKEIGSRNDDVKTIYESRDWELVNSLLKKYHARYVYIGSVERSAYKVQEQKFERHLREVFNQNGCRIYQVY